MKHAFLLIVMGLLGCSLPNEPVSLDTSNVTADARRNRPRTTQAVVASISLSPTTAEIVVGGSKTFTATVRDSAGNVLTGRQLTWTSSDNSIATVSSGGTATGIKAGTVTVSAISGTVVGKATLSVKDTSTTPTPPDTITPPPPPPTPSTNPNEPSGMTLAFDEGFSQSPVGQPVSGWFVESGASAVSIVQDATAIGADNLVLQLKFPKGFGGGNAPMVINWNESGKFPSNTGTLYLRVRVKISADWTNNGNVMTKFLWPRAGSTNHFTPLNFYTDQLRTGFSLQAAYLNGVDKDYVESGNHSRGEWHDIEYLLYQGTSSSANDGTVKVWVDGTLVVNQTKVKFRPNGDPLRWDYLSIVPIYGGGSNPVPHDQYIWIDRMYASVR